MASAANRDTQRDPRPSRWVDGVCGNQKLRKTRPARRESHRSESRLRRLQIRESVQCDLERGESDRGGPDGFGEPELHATGQVESAKRKAGLRERARRGPDRAVLKYADLRDADLTGAVLNNADLTEARVFGWVLLGATLTGANLTRVDFGRSDLRGKDLTGVNLTGAYLVEAFLTGANLTGANLTGAQLTGVDLTGVTCPNGLAYGSGGDC